MVDYKGISVSDDTALRKSMRENNVTYKVIKNTLMKYLENNSEYVDRLRALNRAVGKVDFAIEDSGLSLNLFKKDITGLKQKTKALFVGNPSDFETVCSLVSKSKTISAVDCMEIDADITLNGVPYGKIKDYDVLIYSTDCVSYNVMLDNMYSLDSHKTLLATYNKESHTLITELEVVAL